jgi:hypothetical protein
MNQKRTQARVTLFIAACFLAMLGLLLACMLAFVLPRSPHYIEAQITAEYLQIAPRPNPWWMSLDEGCQNSRHCFTIMLERFPAMNRNQRYQVTRSLVLSIDGSVIRSNYASFLGGNIYAEIPPLNDGLHLLEVEIEDKHHNLYRYAWVLEVTDGLAEPATEVLPPTPLP